MCIVECPACNRIDVTNRELIYVEYEATEHLDQRGLISERWTFWCPWSQHCLGNDQFGMDGIICMSLSFSFVDLCLDLTWITPSVSIGSNLIHPS